jgi:hypothetical protein
MKFIQSSISSLLYGQLACRHEMYSRAGVFIPASCYVNIICVYITGLLKAGIQFFGSSVTSVYFTFLFVLL